VSGADSHQPRMPLLDALQALHAVRGEAIVITTMGNAREWLTLEPHPLDFVLVPSSMGQAPAIGLGLAVARPDRRVIVCNGDGSMLMNLGSLVSIVDAAPRNYTLLLFDNGVYEVTGGQPTPGSARLREGRRSIDFAEMARACGFASIREFGELDDWRANVREVIELPGPTFAWIHVAPREGAEGPRSPGPAKQRAIRFAQALRDVQ